MRIDNTQFSDFLHCPLYWWERNVAQIEKRRTGEKIDARDRGSRIHELLENHYRGLAGLAPKPYGPSSDPRVERLAQEMFCAYTLHYPVELWTPVDIERTFEIPIPGTDDTYVGKFDIVARDPGLFILDHKSETRNGRRNHPKAWAMRTQASLYLWAASVVYGETPDRLEVNVLREPSPGGREAPDFPPRQRIFRSPTQLETAVRDLAWVAKQIRLYSETFGREGYPWPANRNECHNSSWECEYYALHVHDERSPELVQLQYQPTKPYLDL